MRLGVDRHLCACGTEKLATRRGSRDFEIFPPDQKAFSLWKAASETCRSLRGTAARMPSAGADNPIINSAQARSFDFAYFVA
jgi:hypothetical protein